MKSLKLVFYVLVLFWFTKAVSQTRITHYSKRCHEANAGGSYTSISTAPNGDIYSAWMDENQNLRVSKITIATNVNTEVILRNNMQINKFHVRPSIVLDKLGYVHVAADMHNQNWVYYRSLNPFNINPSNFEMVTPPGFLITYPSFFKDKNDDLYITFRHKVKPAPNLSTPGSSGGGIIRYNAVTKVFTMLGGTNHGLDKTVVWVNMGGAGTFNTTTGITTPGHYQQPSIRLFFDNNNRMHLVCNLINQPTTGAAGANTHVLYAYSDDGGNTFRRINGTTIGALPMGPDSMTVVISRTQADIGAGCHIGAFDTNKPIISWNSAGDGSRIVFWNGRAWQLFAPGGTYAGRKLYSRPNGETLFFIPEFNYLLRTFNGGLSYQRYNFTPKYSNANTQPTGSEIMDADYYIKSGNVRYHFSNSTTEDTIFLTTIPFNLPLPVRLISFRGNKEENRILLQWSATNEEDALYYIVEKLQENNEWASKDTIKIIRNQSKASYGWTDVQLSEKNVYRLRIVEKDGAIHFSSLVTINYVSKEQVIYDPQAKQILIKDAINTTKNSTYFITNTSGMLMKKGVINATQLNVATLPTGVYYFRSSNGWKLTFTHFK